MANNEWTNLDGGLYIRKTDSKNEAFVETGSVPLPVEEQRVKDQKPGHKGPTKVKGPDKYNDEPENVHSYTVGDRGPVLAEDTVLHETLGTFVTSKGRERAVHVKGFGAFGYFKTYKSMKEYTQLPFLQKAGQQTPVTVRYSLAVSTKGTPDTSRNVRGFATKFYTDDGIYDLLCNHIPVFLVRDAMRFPESIKSFLPSPVNNLGDPERFWSFVSRCPESTHFVTWLYSDIGTIKSLRHIRAYGVNTYAWVNANGRRLYVKYHWIPLAGEECIDRKEAAQLAGANPDVCGQDLYNTIQQGTPVEFDLCVQLMDPEDENTLIYDPLDDTKVWDEKQYPLMPVGRLVLNRNPEDYDAQVEKVAFAPANLLKGVEFTNDKMLQGRATVYWDAQRYRLGPDFRKIPVNMQNTFNPDHLVTSGLGTHAKGEQVRADIPKQDNFAQAGQRYNSLSATQKEHLVDNIASELYGVSPEIRDIVMGYFNSASAEFANKIQQQMALYQRQKK